MKVEFRDGKKWTWSEGTEKKKNKKEMNPLEKLMARDDNQMRRAGWAR